MIPKPLKDITFADIEQLVVNEVYESKSLDYKEMHYDKSEKREIAKDLSSFANTVGGDLIVGVKEDGNGKPIAIPGVPEPTLDAEILRIESIVQSSVRPAIGIHPHTITFGNNAVVVLRVEQSTIGPHRTVVDGAERDFYFRQSRRAAPMDIDQLRDAFALTASTYDRMKAFHRNRVQEASEQTTIIPLPLGPTVIVHLIPVSSFRSVQSRAPSLISEKMLFENFTLQRPGGSMRINIDGRVFVGGDRRCYTQAYSNGIVENLSTNIIGSGDYNNCLLAHLFDAWLCGKTSLIKRCIEGYKQLGIAPPIWCFVSFVHANGKYISADRMVLPERVIDRRHIYLPEVVINSFDEDIAPVFKPLCDALWNSGGWANSPHFDTEGKWIGTG